MGLPLPEVGLTHTVCPDIFTCTMGTLSFSAAGGSCNLAGPAQLMDPLMLANQVAFAK